MNSNSGRKNMEKLLSDVCKGEMSPEGNHAVISECAVTSDARETAANNEAACLRLSKPEARGMIKKLRKSMSVAWKADADERLYNNVLCLLSELGINTATDILYTYVSYGKEADTMKLIGHLLEAAGKASSDTQCSCSADLAEPYSADDNIETACIAPAGKAEEAEDKAIEHNMQHTLKIAVPRVAGDGLMDFFFIDSTDDLEPGYMGIPEPESDCTQCSYNYTGSNDISAKDSENIIILPGLAFTRDGRRCGYGGGYYDRFLQRMQQGVRIALCYSWQILDDFETEPTDMRMDYIVTEGEVIDCSNLIRK